MNFRSATICSLLLCLLLFLTLKEQLHAQPLSDKNRSPIKSHEESQPSNSKQPAGLKKSSKPQTCVALLRLLNESTVAASESGVIKSLLVQEGAMVKKGFVIGKMDQELAAMSYHQAEIELASAIQKAENTVQIRFAKKSTEVSKAELQRSLESVKKFPKSISNSQIDLERLNVEKSNLELEQAMQNQQLLIQEVALKKNRLKAANLQMNRRNIHAPFTGQVAQTYVHPGEWLKPGDPVFRIIDLSQLKAEGFLNADLAQKFSSGDKVHLIDPTRPDSAPLVTGTLKFISPERDPITQQVRFWAILDNSQAKLQPGLKVELQIFPAHTSNQAFQK